MDRKCPFKHDAVTAKRDKDLVHVWRRAQCGQLTKEDIEVFRDVNPVECSPSDNGYIVEEIQYHIKNLEPPTCWNTRCRQVEDHADVAERLKQCSRCKVVTYCSVRTSLISVRSELTGPSRLSARRNTGEIINRTAIPTSRSSTMMNYGHEWGLARACRETV